MKYTDVNSLRFYQFEHLSGIAGLSHGVFTRWGGVSEGPFHALNVGSTVGDDPEHVRANREQLAMALGVRDADTRTTWQVHGADVLIVRRGDPAGWPPPQADGIITPDPGIPLVMRFADCVPLILYDPVQRVLGLAHAGWRGTVAGAGPATVERMAEVFGSKPGDILAGIGPSIGPCCYEVGDEVVEQVGRAFGPVEGLVHRSAANGKNPHLDLWAANEHALRLAGVGHVEQSGICTACNTHEFYSHRAESGRTGRFGVLAVIENGSKKR